LRERALFYFKLILGNIYEIAYKFSMIVALWIILCKTLFCNCLTVLYWTLPNSVDGNGFIIVKFSNNTSFIFQMISASISEISNKLAVIVISWISLCKMLMFNCLIILYWAMPKNVDGNGFPISKLKRNATFYLAKGFLEGFSEI